MASRYSPKNGTVLVRTKKQRETQSGIALPSNYDGDKAKRGIVEAVCPLYKNEHGVSVCTELRVGSTVVFSGFADLNASLLLEEDEDSMLILIDETEIKAVEYAKPEITEETK